MIEREIEVIGPVPPPYGGVAVHVARLTSALESRGWRVRSVASGRTESDLPEARLGNSLIAHALAPLKSRSRLIHLHDRLLPLSAAVGFSSRLSARRLIFTLHGVPTSVLTGKPVVGILLKSIVRAAAHVIAVNVELGALIAPLVGNDRVTVLPAYLPPSAAELSSLDPRVATWLKHSDGAKPLFVLMIYRLLPPKRAYADVYGLGATADAITLLGSDARSIRLAILLSEPAREGREQSLLAREMGRLKQTLGDACELFRGAYGPPVLQRAQVLLRPTTTDGDAVSVREALDLGCAVIASDVAPRPEGCILYPGGDAVALAASIRSMIERAPDRPRRSEPLADPIAVYEEIYQQLL